ncbi:hypothetical protein [Virgibacillus necropolis]|uniref:Uncharacterized protein n=1 Tax=Virgibacillus necropolis TaxID=163877 RepID=A0A221M9C1_9BACI|nr:hypothetical protein [Virgibacillus necropolis]ASN04248.1 hypothetical protein CFK40_04110 [Virgibacillus necropolis]
MRGIVSKWRVRKNKTPMASYQAIIKSGARIASGKAINMDFDERKKLLFKYAEVSEYNKLRNER